MNAKRIGMILVRQGVITRRQVRQVLERQQQDARPFGELATQMFDLDEQQVLNALALQVALRCPQVRLCQQMFDDACLSLLTAAQAWDNLVLPLRLESGELVAATTYETLPAAIGLLQRRVPRPFRLVLADVQPLEQFIAERYAYEGVEVGE